MSKLPIPEYAKIVKKKCRFCNLEEVKFGGTFHTLMGFTGKDPNTYTQHYECANGHYWVEKYTKDGSKPFMGGIDPDVPIFVIEQP